MSRNYRFDNIKFILIALVVFGHFLELMDGQAADSLYRVIYLFHIPAFIFITGYFAKFNPSKILFGFIMPYVLLQILYLVFHAFVIQETTSVSLQFTKPYWLLWYLMTIAFYYLLIPVFETKDRRKQILTVTVAVTVSLLAGFDENIGYFLSLSRFFTFLPYFLGGYYLAHNTDFKQTAHKKKTAPILPALAATGVIISIIYIVKSPIRFQVLYGSYSYESMEYGSDIKLILTMFASCWIILLLHVIPNKRVSTISQIGKNTFPIFVLHGFFIKLADKYVLFQYSERNNLLLALTLTGAILILLGNRYTARLFQIIFTGTWINKLSKH